MLIRQSVQSRQPLPPAIQNAPELQLGLELFYGAFFDLTSCRPVGMGEGPIPWLAIREYCAVHDIHGDQRDDMFYHIRALDVVYLKHQAKQIKASAKKKGK